jgi:hypothetical protein
VGGGVGGAGGVRAGKVALGFGEGVGAGREEATLREKERREETEAEKRGGDRRHLVHSLLKIER